MRMRAARGFLPPEILERNAVGSIRVNKHAMVASCGVHVLAWRLGEPYDKGKSEYRQGHAASVSTVHLTRNSCTEKGKSYDRTLARAERFRKHLWSFHLLGPLTEDIAPLAAEHELRSDIKETREAIDSERKEELARRRRVQQFNVFNEMTEEEAVEYAMMLSREAEEERALRVSSSSSSPPGSDGRDAEFMAEDLEGIRLDEEIDYSPRPSTNRRWDEEVDDDDFSYSPADAPTVDSSSRGSSYSKVQMMTGGSSSPWPPRSTRTGDPSPAAPDFEPASWPKPGSLPSTATEEAARRIGGPSSGSKSATTVHASKGWSEVARSPPSASSSVIAASPSLSPSLRAQTGWSRRPEDDDDDLRFAIELSLAEERSRLEG
jgi:hypothetical protein